MGRLSTQVIDTASGAAATGMAVALYRFGSMGVRSLLAEMHLDAEGRATLLPDAEGLRPGCYELVFQAGDYFRDAGAVLADPPFLDEVPIRFSVAEARQDYHLPLLISPWSYTVGRSGRP